jgi:hypothetical protein
LLQVKQLADFKTAELNAKVLQLESHIHWLKQDNQRLQEELQQTHQEASASDGAAAASGGPNVAALQVRAPLRLMQSQQLHVFTQSALTQHSPSICCALIQPAAIWTRHTSHL